MPRLHSESGNRDIAISNEILRTIVGSGVHGTAVEGTDDHDLMGVYIEPAANVIGLAGNADHYIWRTQPEGHKSGPGDVDLTLYSLRKILTLLIAGNPTVMQPLWAPEDAVYIETPVGAELRQMRRAFLSQQVLHRHLGFLDGQLAQLDGKRAKRTLRPQLVAQFGYDVKAAGHALRLAFQGIELAEEGRLTLPMIDAQREQVLKMRTGAWPTLAEALAIINAARDRLARAINAKTTLLPEHVDLAAISAWSVQVHQRHWADMTDL